MENKALASEIRPLEDGRSGTEIVGAGGKRVCVCVCVCVVVVVVVEIIKLYPVQTGRI